MAGQCAGLVKKEQTCQEMIEELMAQTAGLLGDGDFWEKKSVFLGRTSVSYTHLDSVGCGSGDWGKADRKGNLQERCAGNRCRCAGTGKK